MSSIGYEHILSLTKSGTYYVYQIMKTWCRVDMSRVTKGGSYCVKCDVSALTEKTSR